MRKNLFELDIHYIVEDSQGNLRKMSDYELWNLYCVRTGYLWNDTRFYLYDDPTDPENYCIHIDNPDDSILSAIGFAKLLKSIERKHKIKIYSQYLYNQAEKELAQEIKNSLASQIPF